MFIFTTMWNVTGCVWFTMTRWLWMDGNQREKNEKLPRNLLNGQFHKPINGGNQKVYDE